ncbi:helix-turn-helix domain-containing protein [Nocardioides massiliensis]|uniref:Transcriptional regulator with XRE-family HTH domain n=1 Tax=Nocardioides massiliensis TaxID=1325935 RepID=A0ABT9NS16_9ACTN|nr:helix-turn-helix transcriptional regulator [Nocardioides massiliensis]MDP9823188.1 transcriptional regulator with XRE-family HTH domain [Nocardioides massiliensis]
MPSRPRSDDFATYVASLSEKVRAARHERGWSQLTLAQESGVSFRQIQLIESNANNLRDAPGRPQPANPKLDTIYLLAIALEVDMGYLVDPDRPVVTQRRD